VRHDPPRESLRPRACCSPGPQCQGPAYARTWSARHRRPGQHRDPITRAFLDVLPALVWAFHNSRSGSCFPSYETIAGKAECARSTVAEALKVLEWAGVLTRASSAPARQRDRRKIALEPERRAESSRVRLGV
jgi:Helix-turn-helix domain